MMKQDHNPIRDLSAVHICFTMCDGNTAKLIYVLQPAFSFAHKSNDKPYKLSAKFSKSLIINEQLDKL